MGLQPTSIVGVQHGHRGPAPSWGSNLVVGIWPDPIVGVQPNHGFPTHQGLAHHSHCGLSSLWGSIPAHREGLFQHDHSGLPP